MALSNTPDTVASTSQTPPAEIRVDQNANSYYHLAETDPANDLRYLKRLYAVGAPGTDTMFIRVPVPKVDLNQPAEVLWIISAVDGILREDRTDKTAVSKVVERFEELLKTGNVKVIFLSSSPLEHLEYAEEWERDDSEPIRPLIEKAFGEYVKSGQVEMLGAMAGQRIINGKVEFSNSYTAQQVYDASYLMLYYLLKDSIANVTDVSQEILKKLELLANEQVTDVETAHRKLKDIVMEIRKKIDPEFKLINRGSDVMIEGTKKYWIMSEAYHRVRDAISHPNTGKTVFNLPAYERNIVYYSGVSGKTPVYNLRISKETKKEATERIVNEFSAKQIKGLTLAFGDLILDVPMYFAVHLAFHMGSAKVPMGLSCPVIIRNKKGEDHQFTRGTEEILEMLVDSRKKPINQWPYMIFPAPEDKKAEMYWKPISIDQLDKGQ